MTKRKSLYISIIIYLIFCLFFFLYPFSIRIYDSYEGQIIEGKRAILISKKPISLMMGYIDNKKYFFKVEDVRQEDDYFLITIEFLKKPLKKQFTIYIKKLDESFWKLLLEEWRKEWNS